MFFGLMYVILDMCRGQSSILVRLSPYDVTWNHLVDFMNSCGFHE